MCHKYFCCVFIYLSKVEDIGLSRLYLAQYVSYVGIEELVILYHQISDLVHYGKYVVFSAFVQVFVIVFAFKNAVHDFKKIICINFSLADSFLCLSKCLSEVSLLNVCAGFDVGQVLYLVEFHVMRIYNRLDDIDIAIGEFCI